MKLRGLQFQVILSVKVHTKYVTFVNFISQKNLNCGLLYRNFNLEIDPADHQGSYRTNVAG